MGAPSTHGQHNKTHKSSRHAGVSARKKQRLAKEGNLSRASVKGAAPGGKVERMLASKQNREAKRQELLERKRRAPAPIVLAILPLSDDVDVDRLWSGILSACASSGHVAGHSKAGSMDGMDIELPSCSGKATVTVSAQGRPKLRLTLLPPPADRQDPLVAVELARSAEVLVLAFPGAEGQTAIDAKGELALAVLRGMGLPSVMAVVQQPLAAGGPVGNPANALRERSAAKKRAEKVVAAQLSGDHRVLHADSEADFAQLVRHLAEVPVSIPLWRQQRPSVLVEAASFRADATQDASTSSPAASTGTLLLTGYVRCAGLSANQLITVPGAGDFQIDRIEGLDEPGTSGRGQDSGNGSRAGGTRANGGSCGSDVAMGGTARLLAQADPTAREALVRENVPTGLEGEQTWPTEEELAGAARFGRQMKRRRVPAGTSEYQAAWIPEDSDEGGDTSDLDEEGDSIATMQEDGQPAGGAADGEACGLALDEDDDAASDGMVMEMEEDSDEDGARVASKYKAAKAARRQKELDELDFPDEVDVPTDRPARVRFQKYRGLKSFRSSPWDPKESLPAEYARVFAFENFKRAHRRAVEAAACATSGADPCAVVPGTYVTIHVAGVSGEAAGRVLQRVQHECKMSVVNFGLQLAKGYDEALKSKEEVLMVTGLRSFVTRPIFSADDQGGDKFKMDKFLHVGRHAIASCYAPISYGPLPALAFKAPEGGGVLQLAAVGRLRSCDPDRVVLKKIVLAGYPVRVHKKRAVVRFMFHHPDDIRWFKPVELVTKHGRRGRITEPVGTHGAMKCLFDGVVQQYDAVCMPLYKRVFPKWPGDLAAFSL